MCDEKKRYTKRVALKVARKVRKQKGQREAIFPYFCTRHECWHIGHASNHQRLANMGRGRHGGLRTAPKAEADHAAQ